MSAGGATHDMIVIGAGAAGLVTAAGAAGLGARVALVERDRMGGECLWTGCVPSKALIAAARAAHDAREAARYGVDVGEVSVDYARVAAWVRNAQERIAPNDGEARFRGLGVDVVAGTARFTGPLELDVDGRRLSAKRVVVATGSRPAVPPIPGLADIPFLTNETIFSRDALPSSLAVVGAGPIGIELAQAFARLGSRVTVVDGAAQVLPREDEEQAGLVADRLRAEGIALHLGTKVERVERTATGARLVLGAPDGAASVEADAVLVATGRAPRLDTLDLERGGVATSDDGVVVDASLRTSAHGVWAAGDCVGPLRFTHVADYQARTVVRNAFFPFAARVDYSAVPWVTYTDPELARVGLTEQEARDRHGDGVRVWRRPFAEQDRAVADGRTEGLVKLVTDRRGRILGAHVLGHGAGELIAEVVLAMTRGLGAGALGATIHAYPTYSEAVRWAGNEYTKSRFTGAAKSVARWLVRR